MRNKYAGRVGYQGNWCHTTDGIECHPVVEKLVHHVRAHRAKQQRITISGSLQRKLGADIAACAAPILDDDRLLPAFADLLANRRPMMSVVPPAGHGTTRRISLDG